jgi:hypothetical protein
MKVTNARAAEWQKQIDDAEARHMDHQFTGRQIADLLADREEMKALLEESLHYAGLAHSLHQPPHPECRACAFSLRLSELLAAAEGKP